MKRELICIVCPRGCKLTVELAGKEVTSVSGNGCPRGYKYACDECTAPKRTVTSTVKCSDGSVLSVRTKEPIAKEHVFDCMKLINETVVRLPVSVGDVVIEDAFGTDIIATQNKNG